MDKRLCFHRGIFNHSFSGLDTREAGFHAERGGTKRRFAALRMTMDECAGREREYPCSFSCLDTRERTKREGQGLQEKRLKISPLR